MIQGCMFLLVNKTRMVFSLNKKSASYFPPNLEMSGEKTNGEGKIQISWVDWGRGWCFSSSCYWHLTEAGDSVVMRKTTTGSWVSSNFTHEKIRTIGFWKQVRFHAFEIWCVLTEGLTVWCVRAGREKAKLNMHYRLFSLLSISLLSGQWCLSDSCLDDFFQPIWSSGTN